MTGKLTIALIIVIGIILYPNPDFKIHVPKAEFNLVEGDEAVGLIKVSTEHGYRSSIGIDVVEVPQGHSIDFLPNHGTLEEVFISRIRIKSKIKPNDAEATNFVLQIRVTGADNKIRTENLLVMVHKPESEFAIKNGSSRLKDEDLALFKKLFREEINVIPYKENKYASLFGNVKNTVYYSYNAPWKIEGKIGSPKWEDAIKVHAERYQSSVRAKYLFFDKDSLSRALNFWRDLQRKIKTDLSKHIEIRIKSTSESEPIFFFWGDESNKSIFYPTPFLSEGEPQLIFEVIGSDTISALLQNRFNNKWKSAKVVNLDSQEKE